MKSNNYPLSNGYSLKRAIADALAGDAPIMRTEREPHLKIKDQFGKYAMPVGGRDKILYVPYQAFGGVQQRSDLGGSTFATLTGIAPKYTTGLVAHSQVFRAGATVFEGCEGQVMLAGNTAIPQPAFSTLTDGTTVMIQSDPVFVGGSVGSNAMIFSPLRLGFKTKVSNQLLAQAASIFEPVLRDVVSRGISSMLDNLALFGTGTNGNPLGVFSTVTPTNLGATPMTWANYQAYRTSILQTDLDPDSYGGILSPGFLQYADQTQAYSGASYSIWEKMRDGHPEKFLIGNEINSTTGMASGKGLFLGLWRFLYLMLWAEGLEIVFDKYSSADTFETVVRANLLANVGITFPAAFAAIYQN